MRRSLLVAGGTLLLALGGALAGGDGPAEAPPPREFPLTDLIRQLGSADFAEREAATARLSLLPLDDPPPELIEATRSPNPEVSRRAQQAVLAIRSGAADRALGRERVFARRGKIDRFVASTAAWDIPAGDDRLWQAVLDVAMTCVRSSKIRQWTPSGNLASPTPANFWVSTRDPLLVKTTESYRIPDKDAAGAPVVCWPGGGIAAREVMVPLGCYRGLIVAHGPVRVGVNVSESVVLANGDVVVGTTLSAAIVICDGDVEVEYITTCVVIARGNITVRKTINNSVVIAGGRVSIAVPPKPPPDLSDKPFAKPPPVNFAKENVRRPLDFVIFFELSDVGVDVTAAEKVVRVTKIVAGKPFAAAGVREGDVVTHVGGVAVDSPEALRRLVRDASATKGEAVLTVRRNDTTADIRVVIPD